MNTTALPSRILVVDDEPLVASAIARIAESFGHEVLVANGVESALARFRESHPDVVLTDVRLGERDGLELMRSLREQAPDVPVVLITGQATIGAAMEAIRAGAYDYLAKPPDREKIRLVLEHAVERKRMTEEMRDLRQAITSRQRVDHIVGRSPQMLEVYKTVARVAKSKSNVMIMGESGTGKELVARQLHVQSDRAHHNFVPVNVAAIPEGLLESELFGHIRGAFTGAVRSRDGLFREAHQGTLFLDEIGDMPLPLQAKILRATQEQMIKPVGGDEEAKVDVRLVVATNHDLEAMVAAGQFRDDLFYRMNVVTITMPPLRERREDIPILIEHFLRKMEQDTGRPAPHVAEAARELLLTYDWPGNVRELENVVERAALYAVNNIVGVDSLPPRLHGRPERSAVEPGAFLTLDEMSERYIHQVLEHTGGNRTAAARILGISRRTLHRMEARKRSVAETES